ncbi:hypothetical protein ACIGXM_28385 [Kitasatospora sp. NPDC052896]|uniref:hypothetical protein n=1 Tax=Kitasatospora sp. NPDC052896 TaxID=3364061 RepID=UPI0037C8CCB4
MTDAEALIAAIRELRHRPTGLPASCNPLIADVLVRWARVATLDPTFLNRVGGSEAVALARVIVEEQP